jgi:hypothetical protein
MNTSVLGFDRVLNNLNSAIDNSYQSLDKAVFDAAWFLQESIKEDDLMPFLTGSYKRSFHVGGHENEVDDFDPSGDFAKYGRIYSTIPEGEKTRDFIDYNIGTSNAFAGTLEFEGTANWPPGLIRRVFEEKKNFLEQYIGEQYKRYMKL